MGIVLGEVGWLRIWHLKNVEEINAIFEEYSIEAVIHFAAYAYVGESVADPAKYYGNNVCNTINLLETMRKH